ncbi:MAG TPA: hypothetical protein VGG20_13865 [Thermoanaerobaculia bacterium]|jgi:hypothetical protein
MKKRAIEEDLTGLSEDEAKAFLEGRLTLFRADVVGSQAHERYSLLVAGFSGAVLTALVGKQVGAFHLGAYQGWAATLNAVSLLLAGISLGFAHLVAQTRAGFEPGSNSKELANLLERLPENRRMELMKRLLRELAETRFPPDRWFINSAIREDGDAAFATGVFNHLRRLQRYIQLQGLLFRLQLFCAIAGGFMLAMAVGA